MDQLVDAASIGRVDEVVALLASGVDPNARNAQGRLALCRAAFKGFVGCVKV